MFSNFQISCGSLHGGSSVTTQKYAFLGSPHHKLDVVKKKKSMKQVGKPTHLKLKIKNS